MASDLKKVGLIFDTEGNADFVKSLKNVSASLKENYQDFKKVQAQYDENTSSSQKLVDKMDYLNSAYDLQKNKVRVLREELKHLEESENRDEVAITRKRTSLKAAETQLIRYDNQIKEVNKQIKSGTADLKDYAEELSKTGDKLKDAGGKASILSAGVLGANALASNTAMSLESASNKYIAATGTSIEETKRFESILKNIHDNNYGADYSDIADKMAIVKQQMGEINDTDFQNVIENAYLLEDMFQIDFNESIRGVSGLIKNMGLDADEAFNFMVAGAQNGLNKSGELADNLAEYTQLWGQAGFSAKEMFAILQNGLDSGAYNLDKVNDFVKEFTISLSDGRIKDNLSSFSKETRNAFQGWEKGKTTAKDVFYSVIMDLEKTENKQKALTLASNVWSALGEDNAMSIITSLNDVSSKYDDVANKTSEAQDIMYGGTEAKVESMKRSLETKFSSIGETFLSNVLPTIEKMASGVEKLLDWFDSLDVGTKNIIITILLLISAIGPLLIFLGTVAGSVSKIIDSTAKVKESLQGLSKVTSFLAANPIVLVIAAVAALVAGLIYLWNTNEDFKNAIISGWEFIKNSFAEFDQFLTNIFSIDWSESFGIFGESLNSFSANVSNFNASIKQFFQGIIDFLKGVFTGDWSLAWQGIQNIFGGIFNGLLSIAKIPLNGIIAMLNIAIDGVNFLIKGLNKIKFDVPDWVPKIGGKELGFNIKTIGKLSYMATGGTLLNGAAIVAEAGPELLLQQGNKTKVIPLSNKTKNTNFDNDDNNDKTVNYNQTVNINNYSRYVGPADAARQTRNETKKLLWKIKRG